MQSTGKGSPLPASGKGRIGRTEVDWDSPAIVEALRAKSLRPTKARRWILAMLGSVTSHPSVDELSAMMAAEGHAVQVPTLYQNLNRLTETGLVQRFLDARGLMRFDANVEAHHHLLCVECGRMADAELARLGSEMTELRAELEDEVSNWRLGDVQLVVRGVCPECAARTP